MGFAVDHGSLAIKSHTSNHIEVALILRTSVHSSGQVFMNIKYKTICYIMIIVYVLLLS